MCNVKDMEFDNKVRYLMKEFNIDKGTAFVALIHSKGSISFAKDFLCSDTSKQIYGREAREFDLM